jgi:predicted short-subunit dehydrogenase-like oxidoreductase (DUF2520 family)
MVQRPSITLVGAGSLAKALAPALRRVGYRIEEIISRDRPDSRRRARALADKVGARAATLPQASLGAGAIWLCVSDRAIAPVARALAPRADWRGRFALHSSGALGSGELQALRDRGAQAASLHPMMTFVRRSLPSLQGVSFAVEGDRGATALARRIARDLGGQAFSLHPAVKLMYHAWGAFASPLLVMQLALAEQVAAAAKIDRRLRRRIMAPIVRQTVDNYFRLGPAEAFSGPLARGDLKIVRRHLRALKSVPGARAVYTALAKARQIGELGPHPGDVVGKA